MRRLLIVDIDGVLADCRHRLHFQKEKDYDSFYSADEMLKDELIEGGKTLLYTVWRGLLDRNFWRCDSDVVYLTGRPERTRLATDAWLDHKYVSPSPDVMLMRKDGDYRPSGVVKPELLTEWRLKEKTKDLSKREINKLKKQPYTTLFDDYDEVFIIDDDPSNIKALQELIPKAICLTFGTERMGEL